MTVNPFRELDNATMQTVKAVLLADFKLPEVTAHRLACECLEIVRVRPFVPDIFIVAGTDQEGYPQARATHHQPEVGSRLLTLPVLKWRRLLLQQMSVLLARDTDDDAAPEPKPAPVRH